MGDAFGKPILRALDSQPDRWDITSLRVIVSSGVMFSEGIKHGLLRHRPDMAIMDSLGSSEAVGVGSSVSTGAGGASTTASFRLSEHTKVLTEDGRAVEPGSGQAGMLARSGNISVGYYKDPEKSALTFRTFGGVRYSMPGDWATVEADGTLRLLGRGSVCINTAGEKVFPEEVEEVLKEQATVRDAVVVGVPDERWGEAVVAIVEPASAADLDEADLVGHVKSKLAGYKVPKRVLAVPDIGRAANGKVDYARLRAEATERLQAADR